MTTPTIAIAAAFLGVAMLSQPVAALADERRDAVRTVLGGSFFPFARSFPPPSERCREEGRKLRSMHNDRVLRTGDRRKLRSIGCGGVSSF